MRRKAKKCYCFFPLRLTFVALLDRNLIAVASIQILTKKQTYHAIFNKIRYNSQLESFCCIAMHKFSAKHCENIL